MKKVLVASFDMEVGGVERSLISMLHNFDYKYDVDLMLYSHTGDFMDLLPKSPNLLPENKKYKTFRMPIAQIVKQGNIHMAISRVYSILESKLASKIKGLDESVYAQMQYMWKNSLYFLPKHKKKYDVAISYLWPHYFVAQKVDAKVKIAWIHTDYSKVQINVESELKMWKKYDKIVSISDAVTESFLKVFPDLKDKIVVIENILPEQLIYKQMDEFDVSEEMFSEGVKLLSIGRYCYAKNFDNIPNICSRMLNKGINITWYIIGFGVAEELIKEKIREEKMENHVILLGKKQNPYPYIKACDIYVQPSRYEGKSVAVREAQLIKKPVIITNYSTAKSQLENEIDGLIVPMENKDCADQMVEIIQDVEKLRKISEACSKRDYSNKREVQKLYKLFE